MSKARKLVIAAIALLTIGGAATAQTTPEAWTKNIFFVHGAFVDGSEWRAVHDILKKDGYRCIAHDRRGHGRSSQPWNGYDYGTFAEVLHTLVAKLDLRDCAPVGISMGTGEVLRSPAHRISRK